MKINENEALRYAGVPASGQMSFISEMKELASELQKKITPIMIWKIYPLQSVPEGFLLKGTGILLSGYTARRMLQECHSVVVCAATLGIPFDQWLRKTMAVDMQKSVLLDACGSAAIEGVMNELEEDIRLRLSGQEEEIYLTDRFSCGYGDLPLSLQKSFEQLLDLPHTTGIHVNQTYMMNPAKSVTALIGISRIPQPARIRGCEHCLKQTSCKYQKEGKTCEA